MKRIYSNLSYSILFALALSLAACSKNDQTPVVPLTATTQNDLPADPTVSITGTAITKTNKFTLFSFKNNAVVANSDSATSKWDIGFRSTTIIVNGGTSGPGNAQAQTVSGIFEELLTAPETGYTSDGAGTYAIVGSAGWYNYTGAAGTPANAIITVPGKIVVVKTADGKYAKLEILSYYLGNPNTTTAEFADLATRPASRYYTFRFIYQSNGSTALN